MVFILVLFVLMIANWYQLLTYSSEELGASSFSIIYPLASASIIAWIITSDIDTSLLNPKEIILSGAFNSPVTLTLILGLATIFNSGRHFITVLSILSLKKIVTKK